MTNIEKNVSEDPAPESVPVNAGQNVRPAPTGAAQNVHPVVGGLEAEADDPRTAEPIEPHRLVGERDAKGSVEYPG